MNDNIGGDNDNVDNDDDDDDELSRVGHER